MHEITNLINTVGFPILICLVTLKYFTKQNDRILEENREREKKMIESQTSSQSQFLEQLKRYEIIMDKFNTTLLTLDKRLESLENKIGGDNKHE